KLLLGLPLHLGAWPQSACRQTKPRHRRGLCQAWDLWDLLRLEVPEVEHHLQSLLGFLLARRGPCNVVRLRAHCTVKVIAWHCVKHPAVRGQAPEAAAGRLGAREFLHGWRG